MATTYTFSWRGGVAAADAGVTYQGTRFDVDAFIAGGGITTDDALAALLRGLTREDGATLLTESTTVGGGARDQRATVPVYVQADEPPVGPAYWDVAVAGVPMGVRKFKAADGSLSNVVGSGSQTETVLGVSTGNAGLDTIAINGAIQTAGAAASSTSGTTVKLTAGQTYLTTGITPRTGVTLDLNGSEIKLADGANASAVKTFDYDNLTGTDSTASPRDFKIINGYIDGNKANQTDATKPVLATYGRRMVVNDVVIRNGKGAGWRSEWATSSPFQTPNGFESFIDKVYIHSCDGDGIDWNGPHDTFIGSLFIVKCGASAGAIPAKFADETGRSNGTNVQQLHLYGGNGYNYGLVAFTAGMKFNNIISEGAQIAQVKVGTQVKIDSLHAYTGGINTANAVGVQAGDATHTGVNGVTIKSAVIENCGGGAFDFNFLGDNNSIDADVTYFSGTTPNNASLGWVTSGANPLGSNNGARNNLKIRVSGGATGGNPTFLPTAHSLATFVGPIRVFRTGAGDTRDLFALLDESNNKRAYFDQRGRLFLRAEGTTTFAAGANAGTGATVTASSTSNDQKGTITVTVGTSPGTGDAALAAITLANALSATPDILITPANAAARGLSGIGHNAATGNWTLFAKDPVAAAVYKFSYLVLP